MPVLAIPAFWAAVAGGTTAAGMSIQAIAAKNAAQKQSESQDKATAAAMKSNEETLDFQKQQAALDASRAEVNRKADYEQWKAREARIGSLGQALGLPARNIPDYVPMAEPGSVSATAPAPPGSDPLLALAKAATAKGLRGPAAVDWINSQQPGAAVVVKAGEASPPGKLVWYDKGTLPNGQPSGKFQVAGQWEYRDDPGSWVNGAPTSYQYNPLTGTNDAAPAVTKKSPYGSISSAAPSPQTPAYMAPRIAPARRASGSILDLTRPTYGA